VGMRIGGGGFSFSLGYSDYPVYADAWYSPSWSLDFNTTLSGYGEWVWVSGLGRVWHPYVAADWRPYTHGRWVYTSLGWTWVSYEPWGYVPHHYGSWALTGFGWAWVPGYTYRPANVIWVTSGSYIGWYAAGPSGWSHWRHGFRRGDVRSYRHAYDDDYREGWRDARFASFVDWRHMADDNLGRYCRPGSSLSRISAASVHRLSAGPSRAAVSRAIGRSVGSVAISRRTVRMDGRSLTVVRPKGVSRSISAHARSTVRTALSPSIARTFERGGRVVSGYRSSHTITNTARGRLRHAAPDTTHTPSIRREATNSSRGEVRQRSLRAREQTRTISREQPIAATRSRQFATGTRTKTRTRSIRSTVQKPTRGRVPVTASPRRNVTSRSTNSTARTIGTRTMVGSTPSTRGALRGAISGRAARTETRAGARSLTRSSTPAAARRAVRSNGASKARTSAARSSTAAPLRAATRTAARKAPRRR